LSRFVLDASVVLTWCFPDEQSQKAEIISEKIAAGERPVVTAFWPHEVLNALFMGERPKRLTPELTKAFLQDLQRMRVDVEATIAASVFEAIQDLCGKHGLTSYDAPYLELAMREKCPLATLDDDVIRAAKAFGLNLL
jgi:predicted nucleic acid-binding protein